MLMCIQYHDDFKMNVLAGVKNHGACSSDCNLRGFLFPNATSDFHFGGVGLFCRLGGGGLVLWLASAAGSAFCCTVL